MKIEIQELEPCETCGGEGSYGVYENQSEDALWEQVPCDDCGQTGYVKKGEQ